MSDDRCGQELGVGSPHRIISIVQVGFASNTSNHYRLAWPVESNGINPSPKIRTNSAKDVQIENEKWLDCANLASQIRDGEIEIFEFRVDSVFNNFVIAVILML
jgi:hypothetical protein